MRRRDRYLVEIKSTWPKTLLECQDLFSSIWTAWSPEMISRRLGCDWLETLTGPKRVQVTKAILQTQFLTPEAIWPFFGTRRGTKRRSASFIAVDLLHSSTRLNAGEPGSFSSTDTGVTKQIASTRSSLSVLLLYKKGKTVFNLFLLQSYTSP